MAFNTTKFDNFTFSRNGLVLIYKNKKQVEISFADLDQIYIRRHRLNYFVKFTGIGFLFLFMSLQYLPFNLTTLESIIVLLPVFILVINYKWYCLYVRLRDGTTFIKKVPLKLKTENISILEKVRTEYLYYRAGILTSA